LHESDGRRGWLTKWNGALLFNIEVDQGDVIEGYLIPDGYSDRPVVCVIGEEGELMRLECLHARPAVLQSGRHETGVVGFRIDNSILPGVRNRKRLEIRDAKNGILIYRRPFMESPVQMKVFRMEFQMLPMMKFDHYCSGRFQYALCGLERFGQETALQAFHLNAIESIYLSGRLHLRNFEEFLDKGFTVIGYLPDPYYEMAARLTMLKRLSQTNVAFLGERDRLSMGAAAAHSRRWSSTTSARSRRRCKRPAPRSAIPLSRRRPASSCAPARTSPSCGRTSHRRSTCFRASPSSGRTACPSISKAPPPN
jgi:hypothetical protein